MQVPASARRRRLATGPLRAGHHPQSPRCDTQRQHAQPDAPGPATEQAGVRRLPCAGHHRNRRRRVSGCIVGRHDDGCGSWRGRSRDRFIGAAWRSTSPAAGNHSTTQAGDSRSWRWSRYSAGHRRASPNALRSWVMAWVTTSLVGSVSGPDLGQQRVARDHPSRRLDQRQQHAHRFGRDARGPAGTRRADLAQGDVDKALAHLEVVGRGHDGGLGRSGHVGADGAPAPSSRHVPEYLYRPDRSIRQIRQSAGTAWGKRTVAVHFTVAAVFPLNGSSTGNLSLSPTSYYNLLQYSRPRARIFLPA